MFIGPFICSSGEKIRKKEKETDLSICKESCDNNICLENAAMSNKNICLFRIPTGITTLHVCKATKSFLNVVSLQIDTWNHSVVFSEMPSPFKMPFVDVGKSGFILNTLCILLILKTDN